MSSPDGASCDVDDGAHGVDDVEEPDAARVERRHRLLVRGVEHRGILAAGPAHLLGERHGGERRRRRAARTSSSSPWSSRAGGPTPPTRSGQSRPSEIGSRMSGGEACAIVEPSMNSTIECTIDCGCTTTSMRSYSTSKSRCASMTSSPLFTSVAEFVVTTRPMSHVGCASASAGVTSSRSSRCRPRNGPPDAVSTSRRTSSVGARAERLRDGRVLRVDGHDLPRRGETRHEVAADDEGLLVGQGERGAALEHRERRCEADRAGDAVQHDVGIDVVHELHRLLDPDRGVLDPELRRLRLEQRTVRAGGEPDDLEAPRVGADDVERLRADRTG